MPEKICKVIEKIRTMALRQCNSKGKYNIFSFEHTSNICDDELLKLAKRVITIVTILREELANEGLTIKDITELKTTTLLFDLSINAQNKVTKNRGHVRVARVKRKNILWTKIARLCNIGVRRDRKRTLLQFTK